MSETRSEIALANHRLPEMSSDRDTGLITVKCRCGWKGFFDPGDGLRTEVDWMDHLYIESIYEWKDFKGC
jgi:hypothetical protein